MKKGKLITIEGCEGAGKSTQINMLKQHFLDKNVLFLREPGGTELGEQIRQIILSPKIKPAPLTELMLYCACRSELVKKTIIPALSSGMHVICDRFIDSTTAYQAYGRGISPSNVHRLNEMCLNGICIDLTIFIDIEPARAFKRKGGQDITDRMDSESLQFHNRVYNGYKTLAKSIPRIKSINGRLPPRQIFEDMMIYLNQIL